MGRDLWWGTPWTSSPQPHGPFVISSGHGAGLRQTLLCSWGTSDSSAWQSCSCFRQKFYPGNADHLCNWGLLCTEEWSDATQVLIYLRKEWGKEGIRNFFCHCGCVFLHDVIWPWLCSCSASTFRLEPRVALLINVCLHPGIAPGRCATLYCETIVQQRQVWLWVLSSFLKE